MSVEGFAFILCYMRSPGVSALALRISLWTLCSASSDSFIKSVAGSLCSLLLSGSCVTSERSPFFCRLRGWDWLLNSWQKKKLLPAQSERWKWTPHCVETQTPWCFLHCLAPHSISEHPCLGGFLTWTPWTAPTPDDVTPARGKVIFKYICNQLHILLCLGKSLLPHAFHMF